MSEFDKEAERQKLREKYEQDREKRKETERMSQLLLQGATMTNRHCGTCGDPLFRYEGTEFCATCEGEAEETAQQNAVSAQGDETAGQAGETATAQTDGTMTADGEQDAATDTGRVEPTDIDEDAAGHPSPETATAPESAGESNERQPSTTPTSRQESSPATSSAAHNAQTATPDDATAESRSTTQSARSIGADLAVARESLVRTLVHHAQCAEDVDGPRQATDHLSAVREAAEALAALDRTQR